jgi:hypothetical protein
LSRYITATSVVIGALALAACGSTEKRLDTREIEQGIKRGVERDNPGTKVVSVTCPDEVEQEKGRTFTCHVKGSKPGEEADARVTQVDDRGRVRYVVPAGE